MVALLVPSFISFLRFALFCLRFALFCLASWVFVALLRFWFPPFAGETWVSDGWNLEALPASWPTFRLCGVWLLVRLYPYLHRAR